jgi:hypothetical protein
MSKRGKILRDTNTGTGLVVVEGQQHQFILEEVWKSAVPPKPAMAVDVDFAADGTISSSIIAVSDSQIAKEQAELVMAAARKEQSDRHRGHR